MATDVDEIVGHGEICPLRLTQLKGMSLMLMGMKVTS